MAAAKDTTNLSENNGLAEDHLNLASNLATMMDANMEAAAEAEQRTATTAEAAALDFEPWQHQPGEWSPPSNKEWADLANPHLVTIRMAWMMMFKSKAEMMEVVDKLDDDAGHSLMDSFVNTTNFFEGVLAILKGAEARLLCAGAATIERDKAFNNNASGGKETAL